MSVKKRKRKHGKLGSGSKVTPAQWPPAFWRPFMFVEPALPSVGELTQRVATLLGRAGLQSSVEVEITGDETPLAHCLGSLVFGTAMGKITVSKGLLKLLTVDELEFVLAHEAAHIWMNHSATKTPMVVTRALVDEVAKREPVLRFAVVLYDLFNAGLHMSGDLPLYPMVLRQQELEADSYAVLLTQNPTAARSALTKLVEGDLTKPSHTWEVFNVPLPAMSMQQRLDALDAALRRQNW